MRRWRRGDGGTLSRRRSRPPSALGRDGDQRLERQRNRRFRARATQTAKLGTPEGEIRWAATSVQVVVMVEKWLAGLSEIGGQANTVRTVAPWRDDQGNG
jgi:hypothetical protein